MKKPAIIIGAMFAMAAIMMLLNERNGDGSSVFDLVGIGGGQYTPKTITRPSCAFDPVVYNTNTCIAYANLAIERIKAKPRSTIQNDEVYALQVRKATSTECDLLSYNHTKGERYSNRFALAADGCDVKIGVVGRNGSGMSGEVRDVSKLASLVKPQFRYRRDKS